ncbi:MAG: hypothetical protein ABI406_03095 [Ktedonobacteraceae bacterium]
MTRLVGTAYAHEIMNLVLETRHCCARLGGRDKSGPYALRARVWSTRCRRWYYRAAARRGLIYRAQGTSRRDVPVFSPSASLSSTRTDIGERQRRGRAEAVPTNCAQFS